MKQNTSRTIVDGRKLGCVCGFVSLYLRSLEMLVKACKRCALPGCHRVVGPECRDHSFASPCVLVSRGGAEIHWALAGDKDLSTGTHGAGPGRAGTRGVKGEGG